MYSNIINMDRKKDKPMKPKKKPIKKKICKTEA